MGVGGLVNQPWLLNTHIFKHGGLSLCLNQGLCLKTLIPVVIYKLRTEMNQTIPDCGAVAVEIIINVLCVIHQYIMYFHFIADKKIPTIETQ